MRYLFVFLLFCSLAPVAAQLTFLTESLHGKWLLTSHFYTYQSAGTATIDYTKDFQWFALLRLDGYQRTYAYRNRDSIVHQGTFTLTVDTLFGSEERIRIILQPEDHGSSAWKTRGRDAGHTFFLTRLFTLASSSYGPGMCGEWDTYRRVDSDFFDGRLRGGFCGGCGGGCEGSFKLSQPPIFYLHLALI